MLIVTMILLGTFQFIKKHAIWTNIHQYFVRYKREFVTTVTVIIKFYSMHIFLSVVPEKYCNIAILKPNYCKGKKYQKAGL